MSAPCSKGRIRYGVAIVLSTMSGMVWRLAMAAMAARSVMTPPGLAIDSTKIARVFSLIAARTAASSSRSTNVADQPKRRIVCPNCVTVPP